MNVGDEQAETYLLEFWYFLNFSLVKCSISKTRMSMKSGCIKGLTMEDLNFTLLFNKFLVDFLLLTFIIFKIKYLIRIQKLLFDHHSC